MALSRCGALESDTEELDTEERDNRRSERRLSELAKKRKSAEANRQTAQKHCTGEFFASKNTKASRLIFERPIEA